MAVPATNAELAAALRIDADDPRLTTLSPALSDWLDTRINNSPVPATVKKEAFIRLVAYIYDMPESAGSMGWARPFVNSGAAALLSDYLIQGAAILSADAAAALSVASIAGHYVTAVAIDGSTLVITFSNAQEVRLALPQPQPTPVADGSIGVDQLAAGVVSTLNKSVPFDGVSISGAVLTFVSSAGQRTDINLPASQGTVNPRTDAEIRAQIAAALVAGGNVTITPSGSGAAQTFTIAATDTDTNTQRTDTEIRSEVQQMLAAGANITITPAGRGDNRILTIAATPGAPDTTRSDADIRAQIAAALVAGGNVTITPSGSGAAQTFTIAATDTDTNTQRTDAEINALVDARIPVARRVPDFAIGDAGEVLTVAPNGRETRFGNATVKAVQHFDAIPGIAGYTVGDLVNVDGELYELVEGTDNLSLNQIAGLAGTPLANYQGDAVFQWNTQANPGNIRLYIPRGWYVGTDQTIPATLYGELETDNGSFNEIVLGRSSGDDGSPVTRWAYHRTSDGPKLPEITGAKHYLLNLYTDAEHVTPFSLTGRVDNHWQPDARNRLTLGQVDNRILEQARTGNGTRWGKIKLPMTTVYTDDLATTAQMAAGTADRVPDAAKVKAYVDGAIPHVPGTSLLDHEFPGMTLARTDRNQRPAAPTALSPVFDLDTEGNGRGEFHLALTLTIAPVSDANMGFQQGVNQTAEQRRVDLSNILFASDLAQVDAFVFSSTESLSGLVAFTQVVYSNLTEVGTYRFLMVRNANNEVATYHYWEGKAGATGATITAEARITFTPTDAAASAAPLGFRLLWGRFDQASETLTHNPNLSASRGIASVVRNGIGSYRVTFSEPFADNVYITMVNPWGAGQPINEVHNASPGFFDIVTKSTAGVGTDLLRNTGCQFIVLKPEAA